MVRSRPATARSACGTTPTREPDDHLDHHLDLARCHPDAGLHGGGGRPDPVAVGYTNTAEATTTSLTGSPTDERGYTDDTAPSASRYRAEAEVTLDGPNPEIAKSADPSEAVPGEVVDYTLTVTVPANVQTYAVVRDTLPVGLELVSQGGSTCDAGGSPCVGADDITATPLSASGQTIGWLLGSIADSDVERVVTLTYTARVTGPITGPGEYPEDGDKLTNTAELLFEDTTPGSSPTSVTDIPGLGLAGSDTDTADVDVVEPHLTLVKEVRDGAAWVEARRVVPGETVVYRIIVTNDGNAPAHDVVVTDDWDDRMTGFAPGTGEDTVWTSTSTRPVQRSRCSPRSLPGTASRSTTS